MTKYERGVGCSKLVPAIQAMLEEAGVNAILNTDPAYVESVEGVKISLDGERLFVNDSYGDNLFNFNGDSVIMGNFASPVCNGKMYLFGRERGGNGKDNMWYASGGIGKPPIKRKCGDAGLDMSRINGCFVALPDDSAYLVNLGMNDMFIKNLDGETYGLKGHHNKFKKK
jgi:hypothetical protein